MFPVIDRTLNETIVNLNRVNSKYSEVESTYDEMSSMYNDKFIRNTLVRSLILSFVSIFVANLKNWPVILDPLTSNTIGS